MLLPAIRAALHQDNVADAFDAKQAKTALSFGYEWQRFPEMYAEWEKQFFDYMQPHSPEVFKGKKVLDAGCGNGIWAIEVAEQYPTAEVAAIDVSNFQFPPQWTIPDNCSFHRLDLMQPIGEEYAHSFDLINVRLLAGPLDATDCTPIVWMPDGWAMPLARMSRRSASIGTT